MWFLEHTSEMPDLGPVRCIVTLVSVGDTSGLRIRFPSRCTWVQILIKYTSGWVNIDHSRCIAKKCQNKIHRNSVIHNHPDVSKSSIHRKPRFSSNPDVFHINFPRFYLSSLAAYSRASQPHLISREYTYIPSKSPPAQAGKTNKNSSETQVFIRSLCGSVPFCQ